ncbi:MAG TPA: hypothetical protein VJT31_08820, partial [Rugosimonospora sp.]|nr:hypothetical protein [Rugosimonospora sp.]
MTTATVRGGVLIAALLLLAAGCTTTPRPKPPPHPGSPPPSRAYTVDDFFGTQFRMQDFGSFGANRVSVRPSSDPRFATVLRVRYPANSASQLSANTDNTSDGGAQFYLGLAAGARDEAYLRYYIRLPEGFNFVKGGKLPGLYGGRTTSGRDIPDGTDGFSTRYMWRTGGAGEVYAYLPSSVAHGTSLGRGEWSWPTGKWFSVQQYVRLNQPGHDDGEIRVWLDGTQVLDKTGLTFRTTGQLRIDGLFFSTFFGGGDASWATPVNQYADFAGFTVSDH